MGHHHHIEAGTGPFSRDTSGLPEAEPTKAQVLANGDELDLRIAPVAHRVGDAIVRGLAYNGSIPGPTLRVKQGSEIVVNVTNDGDLDATVHWHGLRLENRYDGVPHDTQKPIPVGGSFTYRIRFPDEGLYWYHPHIREDYTIDMGLYGNIVVEPADPRLLAPVRPGRRARDRRLPARGREGRGLRAGRPGPHGHGPVRQRAPRER